MQYKKITLKRIFEAGECYKEDGYFFIALIKFGKSVIVCDVNDLENGKIKITTKEWI